MSDINLPEAVGSFVAAANAHDAEALFGVFADGAVVRDDGSTLTGEAEIRGWIQSHMIGPRVVLSPTPFEDGRLVASSNADLPGGPWPFAFDFVTKDNRVSALTITQA
ncbi:nuclear transport factor 2 family protein [Actinoplanes couchii]|uniref:SnoaL-like domain-containing protein n=1 Tax=Actinoplanes couchii TaxID=403638 RepID=A0ABQ3XQP2_9ACTN|nr:nuclear transport factor 2 family protein [Actinoplanes couchii]MDR6318809.1 hypothetical protein [Actinoplanes couchii]GID60841.1 hypothetical protein Aco03nite_092450 [Actinoplanes couchii]